MCKYRPRILGVHSTFLCQHDTQVLNEGKNIQLSILWVRYQHVWLVPILISRDSSESNLTFCGFEDRGSTPGNDAIFTSSPYA